MKLEDFKDPEIRLKVYEDALKEYKSKKDNYKLTKGFCCYFRMTVGTEQFTDTVYNNEKMILILPELWSNKIRDDYGYWAEPGYRPARIKMLKEAIKLTKKLIKDGKQV